MKYKILETPDRPTMRPVAKWLLTLMLWCPYTNKKTFRCFLIFLQKSCRSSEEVQRNRIPVRDGKIGRRCHRPGSDRSFRFRLRKIGRKIGARWRRGPGRSPRNDPELCSETSDRAEPDVSGSEPRKREEDARPGRWLQALARPLQTFGLRVDPDSEAEQVDTIGLPTEAL